VVSLFDALFVPKPLRDAIGGGAWVQAMLDAEAALARAQAAAGVIPPEAAQRIVSCCDASGFDVEQIGEEGRRVANPAEPLVRRLREQAGDARDWVHYGATSQDVVDTAMMLVAQRARTLIMDDVDAVATACAKLADGHRSTVMAARTLLQQAVPTTFGLKAAGWLVGVGEARNRLAQVELAAQLGGAAGTLASLGDKGVEVMRLFAKEVGLAEPPLPWHANRVRVAELAAALELVAGACGKIAVDVTLLAQSEVGEVSAPAGGSTAMAHKRNPATAVVAVAAARQVAPRIDLLGELERSAGAWQAEWATITAALGYAGGAAAATRETLDGLEVDAARMRANIHAVVAAEPEASDVFVDRALEWYGR
jgi:3-carboxy-cis,cis-muconate cycloisomerase